ncbi:MAG: disulfide bond formation protein B [Halofilum sp. (in: g-proteobacteria)]
MVGERTLNAAGAAICFGALAYGILWLQMRLELEPCPLCILDRVAFSVAGVLFLLAALHGPRGTGRRVYAALTLVPLAFGLAVAGRHLWLQSLPSDEVPACGGSLDYMLETFSLGKVIDMVVQGSGSCADIEWQFLGLSIPAWTLVLFVLLTLIALVQLFRPVERRLF